jgi:methylthioribose-1-phosphate isomerase
MPEGGQVLETLRWVDGRLEMIDQRALPERFAYLGFDSAAGVAEGIRSMVVRGAPAIGCAAAYGIALAARELQREDRERFDAGMELAFAQLAASRPTAVNLFWALQRMRDAWKRLRSQALGAMALGLLEEAHAVLAEDIRVNRAMGRHGAALLADGARVLTHCNAGALATGGHGTALGVIRSAVEAGKRISVYADETRPLLQGARLTAWELTHAGVPVTLITDSMAGFVMSRGEVDVVIVGADRVAANADVVNKIGTYMVAVLAQRHGIPFYVACPLSTIDRTAADGSQVPIEERAGSEVSGFRDLTWAPPGVLLRNPAFDVTPAELVTALITERGVMHFPDRQQIAALFTEQS